MKKPGVLLWVACFVFLLSQCANDSGTTRPLSSPIGADSLVNVCEGDCIVDSSSSYTRTGNEVVIVAHNDSGGTDTTKIVFTTVNDTQAVAVLDTSVIAAGAGEAHLVFERLTGSGSNLENDLWRLDTLKYTNDSIGLDLAVPVPGDMLFVLDSETGNLLSANDTTGSGAATEDLLVATIAACPVLFLGTAAQQFPLLAPVDTIDASRSTCDTTWGYRQGAEVYVTSNGTDSLFVYEVAGSATTPIDLNQLMALLALLGGLQGLVQAP